MRIFITGTDTDIGKTLVSTWICMHFGYSYFKPIQTGSGGGTDSEFISAYLPKEKIHKESFNYKAPLSPHIASALENEEIDMAKIILPASPNMIVEGAGGVLVPINPKYMMIDLIHSLNLPVILVSSTKLGTINHTLLSIEALRRRKIKILGVIMNGKENPENVKAIANYGKIDVLDQIPWFDDVSKTNLLRKKPAKAMIDLFKENGYANVS